MNISSRKKVILLVLILIGVSFFIYYFSLNNGLFWDDDDWIINNPFVHDLGHIKNIFSQDILSGFGLRSDYYRPLLLLSFAFNYILGGIKPIGYHLVSNFFHIANGIILFFLTRRLLKSDIAAFLSSLLFLIHPVQTEAVTYISGRGDPMSVFFIFGGLWLFIRSQDNGKLWPAILSVISMCFAVLSRETAVVMAPLIMMVSMMLSQFDLGKSFRNALIKSLPYWTLAAVYFILRLTVLNFRDTLNFFGKANIYTEHLSYRLYTFSHALIDYFTLIVAPNNLHMERDLPVATSLFTWPVWPGALIVALIIGTGFWFYKTKDRSPMMAMNFKIWLFGWLWFFIALAPASGLVPINAFIYEHWLYLPLAGYAMILGFYLSWLLGLIKNNRNITIVTIVVLIVYGSYLSATSIKRNILWGKPIQFYEDTIKYAPNSVRILTNLGNLYLDINDIDRAIQMYQRAIASPGGNKFAQPYYNLGNIYRDKKMFKEAIEQYQMAIKADAEFPFSYQNLAVIYADQGNLAESISYLEKLKKIRSGDARVYYNLGLLYTARNDYKSARENLELAIKYAWGMLLLLNPLKKLSLLLINKNER